jgi:uncharacterized protein
MAPGVQETYIRQLLESQSGPEAVIAWQGGEPTLMGLEFFRRSIELEKKYHRPGVKVQNTIQTNGILVDEEWCEFFRENQFLVGLSLDGPRAMHDAYRVDKGGQPTFDKVVRAARLMKKHRVEFNILTTVHAANAKHPLEVYRFLRDEVGAAFIQLVPIVERVDDMVQIGNQRGSRVTDRSVKPEEWGRFLITIFEEWVRRDVGTVFVQMFDVALASWVGAPSGMCIFAETCGSAVALEHNGDLYSCDHFVEPNNRLGNINEASLPELVGSEKQIAFGAAKRDSLPRYCRECEVRFACHGECPKNRFTQTPEGEPGLNFLCAGYKAFFRHVDLAMKRMADLLARQRPPAEIMYWYAQEDARRASQFGRAGRNERCPCGSGRKFKHCHGSVTRAE